MADLRERGWSNQLIRKHLGAPDIKNSSPIKASGRPQQLYFVNRVLLIEASQAYKSARARKDKLSDRMNLQIELKNKQFSDIVASIEMPDMAHEYEIVLAEYINSNVGSNLESRLALERLLDKVKLLDAELDIYAWHSGICDARLMLKKRILARIIEQCPALKKVAEMEITVT